MRYTGEPAFVLHARRWRETSLLVEVLGDGHGRIGLVARGVHSPKRQVLRAAFPAHAYYGEEEGREGEGDWLWLIDPIDDEGALAVVEGMGAKRDRLGERIAVVRVAVKPIASALPADPALVRASFGQRRSRLLRCRCEACC